jgi:hypothetical protein
MQRGSERSVLGPFDVVHGAIEASDEAFAKIAHVAVPCVHL